MAVLPRSITGLFMMSDATNADLADALLRPEVYPWRPESVERIETHISWVFLAGDRVVKVKRPVAYPFVDHTTLARRHQSCLDEVRLNRRLTEGVYLGVVPIVRDGGGFRVVGDEPVSPDAVIEWATLMRRLPAAGMLDALLAAESAPADLAARLAARLIPFHRAAAPPCAGEAAEVAAAMIAIVTDNLDELRPFAGSPLGACQLRLVSEAMRRFIASNGDLLRSRVVDGWIREGHGDLRTEHVCLEPAGRLQIFDCVEFNLAVRCADVASDLVYLLMDLSQRGAGDAAVALLAAYRAAGFILPDDLLRFYGGHRALVRVKIACLALTGEDAAHDAALTATAITYLTMATAAALTAHPALIVMTGLSGTGKSTVAAALGHALGIPVIATDALRKELAGGDDLATDRWGEGRYAPERKAAVYRALFARGGEALAAGKAVILDGAFLEDAWREEAARLAAAHGVPLLLVETVCDEAVVTDRLAAREQNAGSLSDATRDTWRHQRAALAAHPPAVPVNAGLVQVDTTSAVDLDPVVAALDRAGVLAATIPASDWLRRLRGR
ncbi:MAG: AAA family ATPase [Thermomicrobiales bacterium]